VAPPPARRRLDAAQAGSPHLAPDLRDGSRRDDNGVFLGWDRAPSEPVPPQDGAAPAATATASAEAPPSYAIALADGAAARYGLASASALVLGLAASRDKPKAADYSPADDGGENDENDREDDAERETETETEAADAAPLDLTVELVAAGGASARLPLSRFGALLPPLQSVFTRSAWTEEEYSAYEPVLQTFRLPLAAFAEAEPGFDPARLAAIRLLFDRTPKGVVILDRVGFE
jgi:hypothetical protein